MAYHKKNSGLTLIEVLVALAITAIAITAVIKAATQNIRATAYLQNKTIATWVGQQVLNEVRAKVLKLSSNMQIQSTEMLGNKWYWKVDQEDTPNQRIKKISVQVFANEPSNDDETPAANLESYRYVDKE